MPKSLDLKDGHLKVINLPDVYFGRTIHCHLHLLRFVDGTETRLVSIVTEERVGYKVREWRGFGLGRGPLSFRRVLSHKEFQCRNRWTIRDQGLVEKRGDLDTRRDKN